MDPSCNGVQKTSRSTAQAETRLDEADSLLSLKLGAMVCLWDRRITCNDELGIRHAKQTHCGAWVFRRGIGFLAPGPTNYVQCSAMYSPRHDNLRCTPNRPYCKGSEPAESCVALDMDTYIW